MRPCTVIQLFCSSASLQSAMPVSFSYRFLRARHAFARTLLPLANVASGEMSSANHNVRLFSQDACEHEEPKTDFFMLHNGDKLAYKRTHGSNLPGVIFLPGFLSNMTGEKAKILERYCKIYDHPYIRFDYRACGESSGKLDAMTLHEWLDDVLTVVDTFTNPGEPQILVGSSMGGGLMMHVALKRPERVFGLVGVAAAIDRWTDLEKNLSPEHRALLDADKAVIGPWGDFPIRRAFLDSLSSLSQSVYTNQTIPIRCAVRLLHGVKDDVISYSDSSQIMNKLESSDVQVLISKSADHRFSKPQDLQMLVNCVDQLVKQYESPL
ncbi:palmitoyl-protein thioesterase ABHD10, mitochondrial-like [Paramacrobiotus metropolitanus]|uniref:palmitoyl-protein thioesterase ABHD10, mitochondrial-like n=1 Tax=Paramacrobiotus metropolitanus TaxID=2943436 RepID=UPI0024457C46|nr:palmitoyl-protein thioesterase ABHD10, mitochondrial-like [Paramacrobiotus metropolitanus]